MDRQPRMRHSSVQSIDARPTSSDNQLDLPGSTSPTDAVFDPVAVLAPTPSQDAAKVDITCQRPGEDLSAVEDGPLFRATMKALEQKTGNMRVRIKKVMKKAEAAQQAQNECNEAVTGFIDALRETALSNANAVQPALEHYFEKIAKEILSYEKQNTTNMQSFVIDPLTKLYNVDIKHAEAKKRDFEDESREYYAYLGRYLGRRQDSMKEKKRAESDSKYQFKRKNFELSRFDYSSFMQDLHGGRKEQEVLSHLTRYADAQARSYLAAARKVEDMLPRLEALTHEVQEVDKEFQSRRTEREGKRRTIEMSTKTYVEPESVPAPLAGPGPPVNGQSSALPDSDTLRSDSTASTLRPSVSNAGSTTQYNHGSLQSPARGSTAMAASPGPVNLKSESGSNKQKGLRDVDEKDTNGLPTERTGQMRKEGLLWAMSRPGSHADPKGLNKRAWHKFWVVLDQGRLTEYSNWKQRLDLHIDPIDLRMASVREARSAERRFCFEVITPHYKRVFQATSEEDMNSWISAINNALQSAVEGGGISRPQFPPSPDESSSTRRDIGSVLTGKSSSLSHVGHSHSRMGSPSINSVYRRITVGSRPNYVRTDSNSFDENPDKLLQIVRNTDQGNCWCADCGSGVKTEWVSINLAIVLCIECSGIHRSLGTHISKVRSLTLDTTSFTTDIVELLLQVGNRVSNMVWEARLERSVKPSSISSREQRLRFITAKYVQREYVQPITSAHSHYSTPDETLLASIKKNDIQGVLYGLALGANPNVADRSRSTHAVFLALVAADPASVSTPLPLSSSSSSSPRSEPPTVKAIAFPIAEMLVQNGADVPSSLPAFPLSRNAQLYLEQRTGGTNGRPAQFDAKGAANQPNASTSARVHVAGTLAVAGGADTLSALPTIDRVDPTTVASTTHPSNFPIAIPIGSSSVGESYGSDDGGSAFAAHDPNHSLPHPYGNNNNNNNGAGVLVSSYDRSSTVPINIPIVNHNNNKDNSNDMNDGNDSQNNANSLVPLSSSESHPAPTHLSTSTPLHISTPTHVPSNPHMSTSPPTPTHHSPSHHHPHHHHPHHHSPPLHLPNHLPHLHRSPSDKEADRDRDRDRDGEMDKDSAGRFPKRFGVGYGKLVKANPFDLER